MPHTSEEEDTFDESALCPVCRHMYPPPPHMTHVSSSSSNDTCFVPCVQTIEEIKGHRQKEILAMLPYLKGALERDMPVFVEALAADFKEKAEETQLKKLDALQAQISRDFDALSTDLETLEKMSWY